jgi:hypothetical protein
MPEFRCRCPAMPALIQYLPFTCRTAPPSFSHIGEEQGETSQGPASHTFPSRWFETISCPGHILQLPVPRVMQHFLVHPIRGGGGIQGSDHPWNLPDLTWSFITVRAHETIRLEVSHLSLLRILYVFYLHL